MIVFKDTKLWQTRSDKPNSNWTKQDCFVVDETTESGKNLACKIRKFAPYMDLVLDKNGSLIDVIDNGTRPKLTLTETNIEADLLAMTIDHEYRLTLLELGGE